MVHSVASHIHSPYYARRRHSDARRRGDGMRRHVPRCTLPLDRLPRRGDAPPAPPRERQATIPPLAQRQRARATREPTHGYTRARLPNARSSAPDTGSGRPIRDPARRSRGAARGAGSRHVHGTARSDNPSCRKAIDAQPHGGPRARLPTLSRGGPLAMSNVRGPLASLLSMAVVMAVADQPHTPIRWPTVHLRMLRCPSVTVEAM